MTAGPPFDHYAATLAPTAPMAAPLEAIPAEAPKIVHDVAG
jgi:hypothetical protein